MTRSLPPRSDQTLQFSDLSLPDVRRRIHPGEGLRHPIGNDGAGCGGQFGQFVERVVDVPTRGVRRHDAHKHRRFGFGKFVFVQRERRAWNVSANGYVLRYEKRSMVDIRRTEMRVAGFSESLRRADNASARSMPGRFICNREDIQRRFVRKDTDMSRQDFYCPGNRKLFCIPRQYLPGQKDVI